MGAAAKHKVSETDYLLAEREAFEKSEYYKGEVFAMAGATKEHNKIVASLIGELSIRLKNSTCSYFPRDLRVHNRFNSFYTYPDVSVVCGKEEYLDDEFDTLLNPTILFEVLSTTTENYDRGTKFKLYRTIPSSKNYVLVSSTEVLAEVYTRKDDTWVLTTANSLKDKIYLNAIDANLSLKDIYAQVGDFK